MNGDGCIGKMDYYHTNINNSYKCLKVACFKYFKILALKHMVLFDIGRIRRYYFSMYKNRFIMK